MIAIFFLMQSTGTQSQDIIRVSAGMKLWMCWSSEGDTSVPALSIASGVVCAIAIKETLE